MVLDEMHPRYLLAVHVEAEQLFLFLHAHADHISLKISESHHALLFVNSQRGDLILVIIEVLGVINHAANITESFD